MVSVKRYGLYTISVAAKLVGTHPQTLRIYERKRLVCPSRTLGLTRLYSDEDIEKLKFIQEFTQKHGINLAGVKVIFDLRSELEEMQKTIDETDKKLDGLYKRMEEEIEKVHKSYKRELVHIPRGKLMKR